MASETTRKIILGAFTISALIIFAVTVYFIGDKQDIFSSTFRVKAIFKNVDGLGPGNNVRFNGIDVGTVKVVQITSDTTVQVEMEILEDTRRYIRKNVLASVGTDGLMGNKLVNLTSQKGKAGQLEPGDYLEVGGASGMEGVMATVNDLGAEIKALSKRLMILVETIEHGEGTVGMLLNDTTMAGDLKIAVASIRNLGGEANAFVKDLRGFVDGIDKGDGTIAKLLNDTMIVWQIEQTLANFEKTGAQTTVLAENLNAMLKKVDEGQGAAGTILNDPEFAGNLSETLKNAKTATDKLDELMIAAQHNFLFKSYFKKKAKGKVK